jgi:carbon-monoxide dehydrogenase small subunit
MKPIRVSLVVNGHQHSAETEPNKTLLYFLREDLGFHGAKDACGGEGECGACTVLLDGEPVNACLVLAGQAQGRRVETIEGLASNGELHPLQRAFVEAGGVQCGFCTPGAIMAARALLEQTLQPTDEEIQEALSGNLCRCTGYSKMMAAVRQAAKEMNHAS